MNIYTKAEALRLWREASALHPYPTIRRRQDAPLHEQTFYAWVRRHRLHVGINLYDKERTDAALERIAKRKPVTAPPSLR